MNNIIDLDSVCDLEGIDQIIKEESSDRELSMLNIRNSQSQLWIYKN